MSAEKDPEVHFAYFTTINGDVEASFDGETLCLGWKNLPPAIRVRVSSDRSDDVSKDLRELLDEIVEDAATPHDALEKDEHLLSRACLGRVLELRRRLVEGGRLCAWSGARCLSPGCPCALHAATAEAGRATAEITTLWSALVEVLDNITEGPDAEDHYLVPGFVLEHIRAVNEGRPPPPAQPIPMILNCPACGLRHVDGADFREKPHHTHACQACGHTWRPAIVPTQGVNFLPGFLSPEEQEDELRTENERLRRLLGRLTPEVNHPERKELLEERRRILAAETRRSAE